MRTIDSTKETDFRDPTHGFAWTGSAAAARLFNFMREHGPISRKSVEEQTGLSKSGISLHINKLLKMNLIRKVGGQTESEAKRDISFSVNEVAGYIVGVDLDRGADRVTVGVYNLGLNPVAESRNEFAWHTLGAEETMDQVASMIVKILKEHSIPSSKLWGVGVAVPVAVDPTTSEIVSAPFLLSVANESGLKRLEHSFKCPVLAENDANVMALAEKTKGEGKNVRDFAFLTVGWGIGAGIITNGHLYRGSHGYAGEIGHSIYEPNGKLCGCGNHGCVKTVAGSNFILSEALTIANEDKASYLATALSSQGKITLKDIGLAAASGDVRATNLIRKVGDALGAAVAELVNVLNPALVVVGGPTVDLGEVLITSMRQSVLRRAMPQAVSELAIKRSKLGDSRAVLGAACLVAEQVLSEKNVASMIDRSKQPARKASAGA